MKKILLFMAMMMATSCFAQAPRSWPTFMDESGNMVNLSASNPMPIDGINVSSITVNAFPVYSDAAGNPATATVDANNRAIINIGSDSVGIKTSVDAVKSSVDTVKTAVDTSTQPSNTVATRTITLVANEAQDITVGLPIGTPREFITISAMNIEKDFWLQFGGSDAVINQCMLVNGRVSLPLRGGVDISIIASEAFDLYILEGGKQ